MIMNSIKENEMQIGPTHDKSSNEEKIIHDSDYLLCEDALKYPNENQHINIGFHNREFNIYKYDIIENDFDTEDPVNRIEFKSMDPQDDEIDTSHLNCRKNIYNIKPSGYSTPISGIISPISKVVSPLFELNINKINNLNDLTVYQSKRLLYSKNYCQSEPYWSEQYNFFDTPLQHIEKDVSLKPCQLYLPEYLRSNSPLCFCAQSLLDPRYHEKSDLSIKTSNTLSSLLQKETIDSLKSTFSPYTPKSDNSFVNQIMSTNSNHYYQHFLYHKYYLSSTQSNDSRGSHDQISPNPHLSTQKNKFRLTKSQSTQSLPFNKYNTPETDYNSNSNTNDNITGINGHSIYNTYDDMTPQYDHIDLLSHESISTVKSNGEDPLENESNSIIQPLSHSSNPSKLNQFSNTYITTASNTPSPNFNCYTSTNSSDVLSQCIQNTGIFNSKNNNTQHDQMSTAGIPLSSFKMIKCTNTSLSHDRKDCQYYHSRKDRRRLPSLYEAKQCPYVFSNDTDEGGICPYGDNCSKSHNLQELLYHPTIFRQKYCSTFNESKCLRGKYCAFAHAREEIRCELLSSEEEKEQSAKFFMLRFKTLWCPYGKKHDWHTCPYAHTYQDCRRTPLIGYNSEPCSNWKQNYHMSSYNEKCSAGLLCLYSHGSKEQLYHPMYYKTMPCSFYDELDGFCPRGHLCAFYHSMSERDNLSDLRNSICSQFSISLKNKESICYSIFNKLQPQFLNQPLFNAESFDV